MIVDSRTIDLYVYFMQASYFLLSKFEVQGLQDNRERSDFAYVVHIVKFWGVVPNSGHFRKLTDSIYRAACSEVQRELKTFSSIHGVF